MASGKSRLFNIPIARPDESWPWPGLENIRPYLQGMSSFLQWFDGVKLTAAALLTMEDDWITEQAHWLDRRGVRVVVDGAGISEATALLVVNKLSLIHSGRKDLIISAPSSAVQSAAALAGVTCRDPAVRSTAFIAKGNASVRPPPSTLWIGIIAMKKTCSGTCAILKREKSSRNFAEN
jgi:hypothetical protein